MAQSDPSQVPAQRDSSPQRHDGLNTHDPFPTWAAQPSVMDVCGTLESVSEGAFGLRQAPLPGALAQTFPYYSQLAMDGPSYGHELAFDALSSYDAIPLNLTDQFDASLMQELGINDPYTQNGGPDALGHESHDFTPLSTPSHFNVPLPATADSPAIWAMTQTLFDPQPTSQGQENRIISPAAFSAPADFPSVLLEDTIAVPTVPGTIPGSSMLAEGSVRDVNHVSPSQSPSNRIDWKYWGSTIYHLYLLENHTAEEVCFEMWAIYGVQIAPSTLYHRFKKNKADEPDNAKKRLRGAKSLRSMAAGHRSTFIFQANRRLVAKLREAQLSPTPSTAGEPFACQHAMLHALHCLVKRMFDTARPNSAAVLGMDSGSSPWQLVYHKCEGLVRVISGQAPLGGKIRFLLWELLRQLDNTVTARPRDADFLLHLWKTCVCLLDVRFPGCSRDSRSIFLRIFLYRLRSSFLFKIRNPKDDLVILVECLMRVMNLESPYNLRATLGMGCGKVMDMVGRMVGHNHAAVLNMGSSCARYWKRSFSVNRRHFEAQYKPLVDGSINRGCPSEAEIATLYAYTLAQWDSKSQTTAFYAAHLRTLTAERSWKRAYERSLRYDQITRAFAFSSELLVVCHLDPLIANASHQSGLDRAKFSDALQGAAEAIEVLRQGDLDCIVSAANLSKRLSMWYKSYYWDDTNGKAKTGRQRRPKGKEFKAEKERTAELLSQIGELPLDSHEFSDTRDNQNTRWRRKKQAESQAVVASVTTEGRMQEATAPVYTGLPARHTNTKHKEVAEPSRMEPSSTAPWAHRTCWHCSDTFPSRNALHRHLKSGCRERHPWSEL